QLPAALEQVEQANLTLGPSNSYFFSTTIHGNRRPSAASASRARVKAFSFTRSCCRAASHCCGDTIGGVLIALATAILLELAWSGMIVCGVLHAELPHYDCCEAARRNDATGNQHCGCYADWTHGVLPSFRLEARSPVPSSVL